MSNLARLGTDRLRRITALTILLAGLGVLGAVAHAHYPIQHWLFWRFAAYWAAMGLWSFACLSAGCWVLGKVRPTLPAAELLLTSFAIGVLVFFLGMFAAGLVRIFSAPFAVAWPAALCLLGGRRASRYLRRVARLFLASPPLPAQRLAVVGFGAVGVAMIYFTILSPENVGFDARWYHLPLAEHYVAASGIVPFEDGWYLGAYPHLASILYAWAFLLPGTELFDRIALAAHLEFVFFLATLAVIPLLVRRLTGQLRWESFAALFLFPSILLYDGGLFVGANHVLAFFAIPVYLALLRTVREMTGRNLALLTALLSAALLTEYQAVYLLAASACGVLFASIRAARASWAERRRAMLGVAWALALGVLLTSPHWLFNWKWYGDPLFPMLHAHLPGHPFSPGAASRLDTFFGTDYWVSSGSVGSRLGEAARALVSFSFEPHDWATYHGSRPTFGSLFTILSFLAPVLLGARRLLPLVAAIHLSIGIWFMTSHQDRYLQCLLPWMAVATFAVADLIHRETRWLRVPLWSLIALQVVWGADVYFIPANDNSHEVNRPSPIKAAVDLLSSGYRGEYGQRLHPFPPWEAIGARLPRNAKILLHERYLHLGLGRMAASDLPGWQGGITYAELSGSKAVADRLRSFGVTHVLWETTMSHELDTMTGDVVFFRFAARATEEPHTIGSYTVARLAPSEPPPEADEIAWYDCPPAAGERRRLPNLDAAMEHETIAGLTADHPPPSDIDAAVVNRDCHAESLPADWELGANRGRFALWFRKRTEPANGAPLVERRERGSPTSSHQKND